MSNKIVKVLLTAAGIFPLCVKGRFELSVSMATAICFTVVLAKGCLKVLNINELHPLYFHICAVLEKSASQVSMIKKSLLVIGISFHCLASSFGQHSDMKLMVDSLRYLKADTLDCSAYLYWRIVAQR